MGFLKRLFGGQSNDETVSLYQPEQVSGPFRMTIDDIFAIANRGIVLTGRVESGQLQKGDPIMIASVGTTVETNVAAIESFRKTVSIAKAGDNIGILLPADVPRAVLDKGMIVTKRGES